MAVDVERGTRPPEVEIEHALAEALGAAPRRPAEERLGGGIEAFAYWSSEPSVPIEMRNCAESAQRRLSVLLD
jgi:hypothetical protein